MKILGSREKKMFFSRCKHTYNTHNTGIPQKIYKNKYLKINIYLLL